MKRIFLLLIVLMGINPSIYSQQAQMQEVVYLKNGSVIRGTIIEQVPNQSIKIQTIDGSIFIYNFDEVEKLTKEMPHKNQANTNLSNKYDITGYRGFVDLGYTFGFGNWGENRVEINTSHGYQFNQYIYVGGGTGVHYYTSSRSVGIPLFVDFKGNFLTGAIVPYAGARIGYSFDAAYSLDAMGVYLAPVVGVKFMVSNNIATNLSLGYTCQWISDYYWVKNVNVGGFSLKIGMEF